MKTKDFTLYEEAYELMQLGFDEPCLLNLTWSVDHDSFTGRPHDPYLHMNGSLVSLKLYSIPSQRPKIDDYFLKLGIPTYSQAFRWFREKHNLKSWIQEHTTDTFIYEIRPHVLIHYREDETYVYTGYEEAELACLKKLIEVVKER